MPASTPRRRAAVILAAGRGERMKSPTPKVLHRIAGRTMLDMAIDAAEALGCEPDRGGGRRPFAGGSRPRRRAAGRGGGRGAGSAARHRPRGAGGAGSALAGFDGDVLVTYADVPLLTADAVAPAARPARRRRRRRGAGLRGRPFRAPTAGWSSRTTFLKAIVEAKEATPDQLAITACNSGVIAADAARLFALLDRVTQRQRQGGVLSHRRRRRSRRRTEPRSKVAFADEAVVAGVEFPGRAGGGRGRLADRAAGRTDDLAA